MNNFKLYKTEMNLPGAVPTLLGTKTGFFHNYSCSADKADTPLSDLPPSAQKQLSDRGYTGDKVCVFKPKVQVLDNWGWCNGVCPGGPGGDGCYDGEGNEGLPIDQQIDECNSIYPNQFHPNWNPWTEYKGQIIVIPQ